MSASTCLPPSRLKSSLHWRDTIISKSRTVCGKLHVNSTSDDDLIFAYILDCIGALSCIRENHKKNANNTEDAVISSKVRVFWQTVREIADQEIKSEETASEKENNSPAFERNDALGIIMESFPDHSKLHDGRLWMPLHFAVSLPNTDLMDIQNIFAAQPQSIKVHTSEQYQCNPCHLAVMTKNPRLEVLRRLKVYYPRFGSSENAEGNVPLHLAAKHTDNIAVIRELAQLHPPSLEATNKEGRTPLHMAAMYSRSAAIVRELAQLYPAALEMGENDDGCTPLGMLFNRVYAPEAPVILQVLLDAAAETAAMEIGFHHRLPLHELLSWSNAPAEMVAPLLAAYKDAVNITDLMGKLPVHFAARSATLEVFKMIAEENIRNLSVVRNTFGSVAHYAVRGARLDNLRYIHSMVPDILLSVNRDLKSVLHEFHRHSSRCGSPDFAVSVHADVLRFLLHHCPSLSTAVDNQGKTLYDYVTELEDANLMVYVRRLLLRAGASSQYPGVLEELNYAERRTALLCFFGAATEVTIFSRISLSAAGPELMRTIVSFL